MNFMKLTVKTIVFLVVFCPVLSFISIPAAAQGPGDGVIMIHRDPPQSWEPLEQNPVLVVQRTTDSTVSIQIVGDEGPFLFALRNGEYDQLRVGVYPPSYENYGNLKELYQSELAPGDDFDLIILFVADIAGLDYISPRVDSMAFTVWDSAGTLVITPLDSANSIPIAELVSLPDSCWCFQDTVYHKKKSIERAWEKIDPALAVPYFLESGYYAYISGKVVIKNHGRRKGKIRINRNHIGTLFCFELMTAQAAVQVERALRTHLYSDD